MFRQILFTQWRWGATSLTILAAAGIALPILATGGLPEDSYQVLERMRGWGMAFPLLAVVVGLVLGMTAWGADHRGHHVYALTLPVPRWHYALMRYGAGIALLLPLVILVWVGALVATNGLALPPGLTAFPGQLGIRFALGALLVYSVAFAIASGTNRTAGWILAVLAGLMLGQVLGEVLWEASVLADLWFLIINAGGPLNLFSASWLLVSL